MSKFPQLGSAKWINDVFNTSSVDELKGPSKHTQYHHISVRQGRQLAGAQGRLEAIAAIALDYMSNLGYVKRFKSHPFETREEEFGRKIKPDFLVERQHPDEIIVIEIKTARFLTSLVQRTLESNREKFLDFGAKYIVWTDKTPLIKHARANLLSMRRFANEVPKKEQNELAEYVDKKYSTSLESLYKAGFDFGCVCAAAWNGKIHFQITKEPTKASLISCRPQEDYRAIFLDLKEGKDAWWNSLENC